MAQYGLHANATIGIVSFYVVNSICLVVSIFLWAKILQRLAVTGPAALLSYFLMFINVANLKMLSFYVTISDVLMTFVGIAAIYIYLYRSQRWLMLLGFVSGFVRSGLAELVALLLAYPHQQRQVALAERPSRLAWIIAGVGGGLLTLGAIYYGMVRREVWVQDGLIELRWLSILTLCAYVAIGLYLLFRGTVWQNYIPSLAGLARSILVIAAVTTVLRLFAGPTDLDHIEFFRRSVLIAIIFPGLPLVAHAVYFGPAVLLLILLWRRVAGEAQALGPGFVVMLGLGLCLSINSESRTVTHFLPAFTLALTLALFRCARLPAWGYYFTAVACVLFSKTWMLMAGLDRNFDGRHFFEFPKQNYFMNFGPWMSRYSYVLQGSALVILMMVLACWLYGPNLRSLLKLRLRRTAGIG